MMMVIFLSWWLLRYFDHSVSNWTKYIPVKKRKAKTSWQFSWSSSSSLLLWWSPKKKTLKHVYVLDDDNWCQKYIDIPSSIRYQTPPFHPTGHYHHHHHSHSVIIMALVFVFSLSLFLYYSSHHWAIIIIRQKKRPDTDTYSQNNRPSLMIIIRGLVDIKQNYYYTIQQNNNYKKKTNKNKNGYFVMKHKWITHTHTHKQIHR